MIKTNINSEEMILAPKNIDVDCMQDFTEISLGAEKHPFILKYNIEESKPPAEPVAWESPRRA